MQLRREFWDPFLQARIHSLKELIRLTLHPEESNRCVPAGAQLCASFSRNLKPSSWNGVAQTQAGSSNPINPINKLHHWCAETNLDNSLLRSPSQLILDCIKLMSKTTRYSYILKCVSKMHLLIGSVRLLNKSKGQPGKPDFYQLY